jgi:hypothetical protein
MAKELNPIDKMQVDMETTISENAWFTPRPVVESALRGLVYRKVDALELLVSVYHGSDLEEACKLAEEKLSEIGPADFGKYTPKVLDEVKKNLLDILNYAHERYLNPAPTVDED